MCAKLEQNLVHLEGGREGLDEDGTTNGPVGHANVRLREVENVVPETRFEVVLHLREVVVRSASALDEFLSIVEEVETEVEQRSRHGRVVDSYAWLVKVPSSRTRTESFSKLYTHMDAN